MTTISAMEKIFINGFTIDDYDLQLAVMRQEMQQCVSIGSYNC